MRTEFVARAEWRPDGWWGYVDRAGYSPGYWRGARLTKWGALFAAKRRARLLNRATGSAEILAVALVVVSSLAVTAVAVILGWTL